MQLVTRETNTFSSPNTTATISVTSAEMEQTRRDTFLVKEKKIARIASTAMSALLAAMLTTRPIMVYMERMLLVTSMENPMLLSHTPASASRAHSQLFAASRSRMLCSILCAT